MSDTTAFPPRVVIENVRPQVACGRFPIERTPGAAGMGFDVCYLPPIHPIGHAHRKGCNDSTQAEPTDPGSPWAIGADEGRHTAIHPQLGTLDDFRLLSARASSRA